MGVSPELGRNLEVEQQHAVRGELIHLLSTAQVYDAEAPIVQHVTGQVALLCADEFPMPQVYVRKTKKANACSLPGFVVVDSGLYDEMTFEEDVDAIFAHEIIHDDEGDGLKQRASGILARIGQQRAKEVKADLRGMMLMDRRGINPRGMPSAFEKLAAIVKRDPFLSASPTHGQAADRALNIDQSFLLYDARSLEHGPLTPLSLSDSSEYGNTVSSDIGHLDDLVVAQASLNRQFIKVEKDDAEDLEAALGQQAQLLANHYVVSPDDAAQLARVAAITSNPKLIRQVYGEEITPAVVSQIAASMDHPVLREQCGDFDIENVTDLAERLVTQMLDSPDLDVEAAQSAIDALKPKADGERFIVESLLSYAHNHRKERDAVDVTVQLVINNDMPLFYIGEQFKGVFAIRYFTKVADHRRGNFIALRDSGNKVATLEYLSRFKGSAQFYYRDEDEDPDDGGYEGDEGSIPPLDFEAADWFMEYESDPAKQAEIRHAHELALSVKNTDALLEFVNDLLQNTDPTEFIQQLKSSGLSAATEGRVAEYFVHLEQMALRDERIVRTWGTELKMMPLYDAAGRKDQVLRLLEASIDHIAVTVASVNIRSDVIVDLGDLSARQLNDILVGEPREGRAGVGEDEEAELFAEQQVKSKRKLRNTTFRRVVETWQDYHGRMLDELGEEGDDFRQVFEQLADSSDVINDYRLAAALEQLAHDQDPSMLVDLLMSNGVNRIRSGGAFLDQSLADVVRGLWQTSVEDLLSNPDLLNSDLGIFALSALGMSAESIEVNLQVPGESLRRYVQQHSFDEGLELVFEQLSHLPAYVVRGAVDELIEQKARTLEDFEKLDRYMEEYVTSFVDNRQAMIGLGSIIETNIIGAYRMLRRRERNVGTKHDEIEGMESSRLIQALLSTAISDQAIREYVFERWWLYNRTNRSEASASVVDKFQVEDIIVWRWPGKELRLNHWMKELPAAHEYTPIEEALNNLYLSNSAARYLMVRSILLGEGGALEDESGKQELVDGLMSSWLKFEPGSAEYVLLRNVLGSFMEGNNQKDIYRSIGPIFQDLILHPPSEPADNELIARLQAEKVIASLSESGKLRNPTQEDIDHVTQKILNLIRGRGVDRVISARMASANEHLLALFGNEERSVVTQMSPVELALMSGKKAGALGVRMLQLAGQYYDIPEDERDKFNEVYDSMKGQTRMQAYRVLKREAAHSEHVARLLDDIASIDERLGGGSLVTVYAITLKDGSREVIGVRNPNAEYHVIQYAETVQRTLATALAHDPDNKDLLLAQALIEDAVTWIRDELNDTEFSSKDAIFRMENDTISGSGFKKGRSKYDLYVPNSRPTGTNWIRREEMVDGVNLVNLKITDEGPTNLNERLISREDYQDAVSLLVRNYFYQLKVGKMIHPDEHMGNFRITPDNSRVAVFDRYNLIPATAEVKSTINQTIQSVILGDLRSAITSLISAATDNDVTDMGPVIDEVVGDIEGSGDVSANMARTIINLKKAGIHLPIRYSLILRNIFGLSRISQNAGFSSVIDAFLHTSDDAEVANLLG